MTLLFCGTEEDQVINVKAIILCFDAISSLKVNFFESELIRLRTEQLLLLKFLEIMVLSS